MRKGRIIFLNGVSSSGKSSLSKELIKHLPESFHLGLDNFDLLIEMMEDREGSRLIPVPTEYFFHRTIRMFSDKGIDLIVDHILHDRETFDDFMDSLEGYPLLFVGVHCSVAELSRREKSRGDRRSGLAVSQLSFVHQQQEKYDIEVDTSKDDLEACASQIVKILYKKEKAHVRLS